MKLNGSQILAKELIKQGVDTVFGYPGGAVLDIYDELYKNSDRIEHIITAHEQGAAHAADGYARVTGKPGVIIATSGPGATNLVTGIANAYLDSVPLVAITGNVAVKLLGRDSFQEVDIVGITQPIVKHSYIVRDVSELEGIINEAFWIASNGRKGPVLIDVPKSVQKETCDYFGDFQLDIEPDEDETDGEYDYTEITILALDMRFLDKILIKYQINTGSSEGNKYWANVNETFQDYYLFSVLIDEKEMIFS